MPSFNTLNKGWKIVIAVLVIIFIGLSLLILNWSGFITLIGNEEPRSTLYLYELNGSSIPQGKIISLTEEDFSIFPKLAPVIRDKNQKPVTILENGNRLYTISLTDEEYNWFNDHYLPYSPNGDYRRFFEYKGKFYSYNPPTIH